MEINRLFAEFTEQVTGNAIMYAIFIAPFFVIFWVVGQKKFKAIRIQPAQTAGRQHLYHDLRHTITTLVIFSAMDLVLLHLQAKGYTLLYNDIGKYGWPWLVASFGIVLFLQDTFFYWTHRAMHHPALYRFFHQVHHNSTDPSPLTSGAFHPSEAVVENALQFLLPFCMPLHFSVIIAWQVFDMLNNVLAHLGYELYPKGWVRWPILKYKTASTHHNMHHQLFNGNYALYFTWWDKWMGTEFPSYEKQHESIFERTQQATNNGWYILSVTDVCDEANSAFTVTFGEVPAAFRNFAAGQHVTFRLNVNNETLYRTFSLSSIPNTGNTATVTIKQIKGGKVTPYLRSFLKPGDKLEVTAPSGNFCMVPDKARRTNYVMVAGGSGITPIYSMTGSILLGEPDSRVTLLYANRTADSIIFKEKLEKWAQEQPARFKLKQYLSDQPFTNGATKGYITRISLEETINEYGLENTQFYLCGPEAMTGPLVNDLRYLGVNDVNIHRELFVATPVTEPTLPAVTSNVSATLGGKVYNFGTNANETILQSALRQQVALPHSCQSGLCGLCKMKCTQGKVVMRSNHVLSNDELLAGYILTCQSIPQTDHININNL